MKMQRWLLALVATSLAGPASAVSYFGELKTASQLPVLGDVTVTATLDVDFDPFDLDLAYDWAAGGLGDGYVSGTSPKTYVHTFDPGTSPVVVQQAWLYVSVADDLSPFPDLAGETAVVRIGTEALASGNAFLNLLGGSVTAWVGSAGDVLSVTVSGSGDFWLLASALKVAYVAPAVAAAVPEPGGALAFGLGVLLVGRRGARRRA
jgi:hypothetical protein